jgi:hypothetical protein
VRFSKEAHVIPQGLGNRKWLTWEECDDCNAWAGTEFEDHLVKFLAPMRAALALPTVAPTVSHKTGTGGTRLDADVKKRITFGTFKSDDRSIESKLDEASKTLQIRISTQKFSPYRMAQSLALMTFRAVPARYLSRLSYLRDWLRGRIDLPAHMVSVFVPGADDSAPSVGFFLARRLLIGMPTGLVIFQYGCTWIAWHLPTITKREPSRRPFPVIPYSRVAPFAPITELLPVTSQDVTTWTFDLEIQFEQVLPGPPEPSEQ